MYVLIALLLLQSVTMIIYSRTKKHWLAAKMTCSAVFVATGVTSMILTRDNITLYSALIMAGLVFGAIGDYTLEVKVFGKDFIYGLISFLIGHVLYAAAFYTAFYPPLHEHIILLLIATVIITSAGVGAVFLFKIPVKRYKTALLLYSVTISAMIATSGVRSFMLISEGNITVGILLLVSSLLFAVSDTVLGLAIHGITYKFSNNVILFTYYIAQTLFAVSIYLNAA